MFTVKITCQQAFQTNKMIASAYSAGSIEEVIETYAQAYPKALIGRQEVAVNGSSSLAVSLNPTTTSLDEVVVVGYGTQQRKYMTA